VDAGVAGDPTVAEVITRGRDLRASDVFRAQDRLMELRRAVTEIFARMDAIVLPTTPTIPTPAEVAAEPVAVNSRLGRWTNGINLLDLSALALPAGEGPPFGVSLVAPAFAEPLLLDLGSRWAGERPAQSEISAGAVEPSRNGAPPVGAMHAEPAPAVPRRAARLRALRARIAQVLDGDGPMPATAGVPFTRAITPPSAGREESEGGEAAPARTRHGELDGL
jgi:amidase